MKYKYFLICFLTLIAYEAIFSETKLISSTNVNIKETFIPQEVQYKSKITYEQLLQDLEMTIYYMENVYSGYEDMKSNCFDSNILGNKIRQKYENIDEIDTRSVFFDLINELKNYVNDMHFQIFNNQEYENLSLSKEFFYSNIYLQKKDGGYFVQESNEKDVKEGMKYTDSDENLFYYPIKGSDSYVLGLISDKNPKDYTFTFDNIPKKVELFNDGAIESSNLIKYHEIETENSAYVSISSFSYPNKTSSFYKGANIIFNKFANLYLKWRNKKNIIIDVRGNKGGRLNYINYFLYSMFEQNPKPFNYNLEEKNDLWLDKYFNKSCYIKSPATIQAHFKYFKSQNEKKYKKSYEKEYKQILKNPTKKIYLKENDSLKSQKSSFSGKIIILIDRNTSSAAEYIAILAKYLLDGSKVFIIGENSKGCFEFGDVIDYALPNSGIYLHMGCEKNYSLNICSNWHGETFGVYPDYWSLGKDLNETIYFVTQDEEMMSKLKNISSRLL